MKKGSKGSDKELEKFSSMTLEELNHGIARCMWGSKNGGTTAGRKSFFKLLVWLEEIREANFEIEAPRRDFRKH
jgi:hypothetical protein